MEEMDRVQAELRVADYRMQEGYRRDVRELQDENTRLRTAVVVLLFVIIAILVCCVALPVTVAWLSR